MKSIGLLSCFSFICIATHAQFFDVSYPFVPGDIKKMNIGVGYIPKIGMPGSSWIRGRLDYSYFTTNDLKINAANSTMAVGMNWMLNTPVPTELAPSIVAGYSQPILGSKEKGGPIYGIELDFIVGRRKISFPFAFLRHSYNSKAHNILLLGVRMRPFQ